MTKEQRMDIDALRATVASLDDRGGDVVVPAVTAARKADRSIAAMKNGQIVQIAAGIAVALAGGTVWSGLLARPGLLFGSGLLVNLYGATMIAMGIAGLVHAARIDMAAPVAETEGHMARLRRVRLASAWALGASWWVVWVPFTAVTVRLLWGADMLAPIGVGAWLVVTLASGAAGWAGMALLRSWASRTGRTTLAGRIDDMMTGESFQAAQRDVAAVTRFTAE